MNIRLVKLALLFCLLSVFTDVNGQGVEVLDVVKNESATFTFLSRFAPVVGRSPEHGTVSITAETGVPYSYVLTYTPATNYLGGDDLLMVSFPFGVNVAFTEFDIDVQEAAIRANHDFAATTSGQAISVPVMVNDSVNVGGMHLVAAPMVNAGTVEIVGDQVIFTPAPGFAGITDFNYLICSDFNICDLGTVSVNVLPEPGGVFVDTVRVFTKRNQPQFIFAPLGAAPAGAPAAGKMISLNGVMAYQPDLDFVGDEYLAYTSPGAAKPTVYHITVLDLATNVFAVEDRAYTAIDHETKLNVLHNDLYDVFADCVTFGAPQFGSLRETSRKGEVVYTPPTGWSGVDKFTYSSMAPGCDGAAELQTVYVFVSDFAPANEETTLTTPAGTPVVLTYAAEGGAASWSVAERPTHGTIIPDPTTGQLSYLPNPVAAGRTDQLTLRYCLNADEDGNCAFSKEVSITVNISAANANACVDEDCVWPGDTNNDGVVDVGDLLPIGLAMGGTGTPRLGGGAADWAAQYSEDWGQELNGTDFKHIDANGDQIISSLDTQVVRQNMGLQHRLRSASFDFAPFEISLRGPLEAEPGDVISMDIIVGTADVVIKDIAGFRMPFVYDNTVIDQDQVNIVFHEDSWMSYDSPILSISDNDRALGRLSAAVTRTNKEPVSGFGIIGRLDVVIKDIAGFREGYEEAAEIERGGQLITTTTLGGEAATAMNAAGHLDAVRVNPFELKIKQQPATDVGDFTPLVAAEYLAEKLLAYPNPTADRLVVHLNGQQRFSGLQLTDLTGRVLRSEQGLDTNHRELSLGALPNGIYTLTITTEDGVVNRKVEVVR